MPLEVLVPRHPATGSKMAGQHLMVTVRINRRVAPAGSCRRQLGGDGAGQHDSPDLYIFSGCIGGGHEENSEDGHGLLLRLVVDEMIRRPLSRFDQQIPFHIMPKPHSTLLLRYPVKVSSEYAPVSKKVNSVRHCIRYIPDPVNTTTQGIDRTLNSRQVTTHTAEQY
jgi:hypothetical protein